MTSMDGPPPLNLRPRFPSELSGPRDELDALFRNTPLYQVLGIDLADWGLGWSVMRLTTSASFANLANSLHGGISFSLADAAFEVACNSYGRAAVALEVSCHHHRPAPVAGDITAECWEVARGDRTASYRVRVLDADGVLLSSYLALAYRTSRWHIDTGHLPEGWD